MSTKFALSGLLESAQSPCTRTDVSLPASLQRVAADLDESDVEDARTGLLPRNPSEHLGPRYPLMRPVMHGSRISRKRAAKKLAEERAP
eukprot:scaffold134634_cov18-Tisochrysis_lutea.AAC.1